MKKGKKTYVALALAATCITGFLGEIGTVFAEEALQVEGEAKGSKTYTHGDWEYYIEDNGTIFINLYRGSDTVVEIPSEIDGRVVSGFAKNGYPGEDDGDINVTTLIIPETVTYFNTNARLYGGLKEIIVKEGNPVYRSLGGVVYDKQMKTLLWCPEGKRGILTVPEGVEVIGEYGCAYSRLSGIRLPDSVKKIGTWAFYKSDKITIECSDKSYAKSCAIKRGIPYRIVKKVSAGKLDLTVNGQSVKDNQALKVKVKKSYTVQALRGGIREEVKWKTSNAKVAAAKNGKITVKKAGRATITATASNGKKTRIKLSASKAEVRVSRVQVSGSKTMEKGSKQVLGLTVTPTTANSTKVSWKSSDKKTATVDKTGKVTAKKKGTVVITATARDKSRKKGSIKIKVK